MVSGSSFSWLHRFVALTAGSLGLFFVLAALGHPGAPSVCLTEGSCWCEEATGTWGREPLNTWSNLFVFVGALYLARLASRPDLSGTTTSSARYNRLILLAFAYALWIQASGALYFHGALTRWTRAFDASSVLMVHGVLLTTSLIRNGFLKEKALPVGLLLSTLGALLYRAVLNLPIDPLGLSSLILTLSLEARLSRHRGRRSPLLHISLSIMTLSFFAWGAAQPGRPLCGHFPGHALWHVGMGLTVTLFGLHAAQDRQKNAHFLPHPEESADRKKTAAI